MRFIGWAIAAAVLQLAAAGQTANPRGGDPAAIQSGGALFRERCADCHGADAKGVRGPDLTVLWTSESSDQRVFQTVRQGVPGSIMPSSQAPDEEIWAIAAYLRSISVARPPAARGGDTANGERVFSSLCSSCHRVDDRGGVLGPDLTFVAVSQSRDAVVRAIRNASASFASGYEPMTIVTRDGRRVRGARKGEDAYSVQLMDTNGRLQGYLKSDLRDVIRDTQSLMPDFGLDRLSDSDLSDVLAFLASRRPGGRP